MTSGPAAARKIAAHRHVWLFLVLLAAWVGGCGGSGETAPADEESSETASPPATAAPGYPAVRAGAIAWLDGLTVDVADLRRHGVAGIKKLAEALEAYALLIRYSDDAAERERFLTRARALAAQTGDAAYHDLASYDAEEFAANSMSYFRVAWLMDELGLDTTDYRAQLARNLARIDADMPSRGAWQRRMFARFYDHFELEKPGELALLPSANSVLARRVPLAEIQIQDGYDLTHEVFEAYDYGRAMTQTALSVEDVAYLKSVLPGLAEKCMTVGFPDLLGEVLSSMLYLGWADEEATQRAIAYLWETQNADGSWGDYEVLRPRYGDYVDQHATLHTVQVVLAALERAAAE